MSSAMKKSKDAGSTNNNKIKFYLRGTNYHYTGWSE